MFSFAKTHLSLYLLSILLCIAGLVVSAPTPYHRRQINIPFPYGKLADKILNVNDVSYLIDDREDDWLLAYPDYATASFSPPSPASIPLASPELPALPPSTAPRVDTMSLFSFVYRIPHIIKQAVAQEWDTAKSLLRTTMSRSKNLLEEYCPFSLSRSSLLFLTFTTTSRTYRHQRNTVK